MLSDVRSWINLRTVSVPPQKNELPIANRHATRSAFSRERFEVLLDQAALRIFRPSHGTSLRPCCPSHAASTAGPLDVSSGSDFHNHGERSE